MKHAAIILSVLVVFLASGMNYANAQPAGPGDNAMMQDDPMTGGMMTDDRQCGKGMMGGMGTGMGMGMEKDCGRSSRGMMRGMGMEKGCGCGMKGEHMMGGMRGMGHKEMMMPEDIMEARRHVMRMVMELGLNEKQKEATVQIIDGTAKDLIKKSSDLLIAKMELEGILHKDPVDINAAASKLKQIEAMKTDMFLAHLKAFEEIKSMLTPEQKSELKKMMEGGMGMAKGCNCGMMEEKKAHHGMGEMMK